MLSNLLSTFPCLSLTFSVGSGRFTSPLGELLSVDDNSLYPRHFTIAFNVDIFLSLVEIFPSVVDALMSILDVLLKVYAFHCRLETFSSPGRVLFLSL